MNTPQTFWIPVDEGTQDSVLEALSIPGKAPKTRAEHRDRLEAYLEDMRNRGFIYSPSTSLFWTKWERLPIRPHVIGDILRGASIRAGFIQKTDKYNVAGAHSLRESFGSILINDEVPDSIVDFLLGHKIGEMSKAYKTLQFDKVREIYREREPLLSIYPRKEVDEE